MGTTISSKVTPALVAEAATAYRSADADLVAASRAVLSIGAASGDSDAVTYALLVLPNVMRSALLAAEEADAAGAAPRRGRGPVDHARVALKIGRTLARASDGTARAVEAVPVGGTSDLAGLGMDAAAPTVSDRSARWTRGHILTVLADAAGVEGDAADVLAAVRGRLECCEVWSARSGRLMPSTVARHLVTCGPWKESSVQVGLRRVNRALSSLLETMRADAARLDAAGICDWRPMAGDLRGADIPAARDLARDTFVPESGPASSVVVTRADGTVWSLTPATDETPERLHRLSGPDAAADVLGVVNVPAFVAEPSVITRDMRNGLADAAPTMPDHPVVIAGTARHPAGVTPGLRYGVAQVAGDGPADVKVTPSARKSGPKGGIGGPMLTGRSAIGNGGNAAGPRGSRAVCNGNANRVLAGAWCPAHDVRRCTG